MEKQHATRCKTKDINMLSGGIVLKRECDCDGYHTFDELYEHRITLWISFCKLFKEHSYIWRTKFHSDGTQWKGWFILGAETDAGSQMTYHLPMSKWEETDFVDETLEKAPDYDGHTSDDVLFRLKTL